MGPVVIMDTSIKLCTVYMNRFLLKGHLLQFCHLHLSIACSADLITNIVIFVKREHAKQFSI